MVAAVGTQETDGSFRGIIERRMTTMHDSERAFQAAAFQVDGLERAGPDLGAEHRFGKNGDAGPGLDTLLDVFDVVELDAHVHFHFAFAKELIDLAAYDQTPVEGDEFQTVQFLRPHAAVSRQRMTGRTSQDHFLLAPRKDSQFLRPVREGHQSQISRAVQYPRIDLVGMQVLDAHAGMRKLHGEALDVLVHVPQSDRVNRNNSYRQ